MNFTETYAKYYREFVKSSPGELNIGNDYQVIDDADVMRGFAIFLCEKIDKLNLIRG